MEHTYTACTIRVSTSLHLFTPTLCILIQKLATSRKFCRAQVTLSLPPKVYVNRIQYGLVIVVLHITSRLLFSSSYRVPLKSGRSMLMESY